MADSAARPNIILICVDQWRGDCLSIAGHPVVHTPWLDQLAIDGARFNKAYVACPTCIAARASLFTGLTQRSHGRVGYKDGVPWDYPVTIASEFTRHGYQTQAVGKMHVFPERSQVGFQNVILHDGFLHYGRSHNADWGRVDDYIPWLNQQLGREADYFEHGINCNSNVARPWDKEEYLHPTNWVATQSIQFLRRRDRRKPFFLFLSFHRPHPPYDPPAWAFEQYLHQEMPPVPVGDWAATMAASGHPCRPDTWAGKVDPRIQQRARAGYYGHMTHIDHQINRFLEALPEQDAAPTYICFTSDHGELMGDHHLWRKSLPYEGSAHIPMILKGPRDCGITSGGTTNDLVELRDVMPTLLDCAGLPIPPSIEGRSFLPMARGAKAQGWREYLHGEHLAAGGSTHYITDSHHKYIWFSATGQEQLFDLDRDPQELHDASRDAGKEQILAGLRQHLVKELTGREEAFTDGQKLIAGRPVTPVLSHVLQEA